MMYFAEIHPTEHTVIRVVVADSIEWCEQNITTQIQTGTTPGIEVGDPDILVYTPTYWLETSDPYAPAGAVSYCGPGYGADRAVPERFALPWDETAATIPNEEGEYAYATQGQVVFYNGKIWRNLLPTGNPNVFPPPTNWREYPMGVEHPVWIQPVGSVDAYPVDFIVEHNNKTWKNITPDNVWEPGTGVLWEEIVDESAAPAGPLPWVQPVGSEDAYNIGDQVTFEGQVWESVINANTWSPTVYPAGWALV